MRQTAVEWFFENLKRNENKAWYLKHQIFEDADKIFEAQIIDAFEEGKKEMERFNNEIPDEDDPVYLMSGEEFYNKTFKSE